MSILLYGCTTEMLRKCIEKKLDRNYTRILQAVLNKSWKQYPTKQQVYGHLPPISKTIYVRQTKHTGHCWRSKDKLIRDILLWIPTHWWATVGWPARNYLHQLCADTGWSLEDVSEAKNNRDRWRERVKKIHAGSATWWWWYIYNIE